MKAQIERLDEQLTTAVANHRRALKLERQIAWIDDQLRRAKRKRRVLAAHVTAEQRDVAAAQRGLHHVWLRLASDPEERIAKEEAEALHATAAYNQVLSDLQFLHDEQARLVAQRQALGDHRQRLTEALDAKEAVLVTTQSRAARRLRELVEEIADTRVDQIEIDEALAAANVALAHLDDALGALQAAQGLGTWDMLGGGVLVSMAKHSRLDEAHARLYEAQHALERFHRELSDVVTDVSTAPDHLVGPLASALDVIFDSFFADVFVQGRINESLAAAQAAREEVATVRTELDRLGADTRSQLQQAQQERVDLLLQVAGPGG